MSLITVPLPPLAPRYASRPESQFHVDTRSSTEDMTMLFGLLNLMSQNQANRASQGLAERQFDLSKSLAESQKSSEELQTTLGLEGLLTQQIGNTLNEKTSDFQRSLEQDRRALVKDIVKGERAFEGDIEQIRRNAHLAKTRSVNETFKERVSSGLDSLVSKARERINATDNDFERLGIARAVSGVLQDVAASKIDDPNIENKVFEYQDSFAPFFQEYNPLDSERYIEQAITDRSEVFQSSLDQFRSDLRGPLASARTLDPKTFSTLAESLLKQTQEHSLKVPGVSRTFSQTPAQPRDVIPLPTEETFLQSILPSLYEGDRGNPPVSTNRFGVNPQRGPAQGIPPMIAAPHQTIPIEIMGPPRPETDPILDALLNGPGFGTF